MAGADLNVIRYPTIGYAPARTIGLQLLSGVDIDLAEHVVHVGDEAAPLLDLDALEALGDEVPQTISEFEAETEGEPDKDALEGRLAIDLYSALDPARVSFEALDDPAFWRYVGLRHLWPFVRWREPALQRDNDWTKIAPYVDGLRSSECVALRMFVRASIAREAGSIELSSAVPRATDFWRSHLVRVGTGSVPPLARALIESQARDRLAADRIRATARRVNRTRTNVLMHQYEASEADEFVKAVW
jgi:hypothetical protein